MKVEAMQEKLYEFEVGDSQFSESLSHHIACSGEQEEQPPFLRSAQRCQGDAKAAFAKSKSSSSSLVSSLKFLCSFLGVVDGPYVGILLLVLVNCRNLLSAPDQQSVEDLPATAKVDQL